MLIRRSHTTMHVQPTLIYMYMLVMNVFVLILLGLIVLYEPIFVLSLRTDLNCLKLSFTAFWSSNKKNYKKDCYIKNP